MSELVTDISPASDGFRFGTDDEGDVVVEYLVGGIVVLTKTLDLDEFADAASFAIDVANVQRVVNEAASEPGLFVIAVSP